MPILDRPSLAGLPDRLTTAFNTLLDEAGMLVRTLLSPTAVIDEVKEMHALQTRANAIEAEDPWRASVLRWRASRIGLR